MLTTSKKYQIGAMLKLLTDTYTLNQTEATNLIMTHARRCGVYELVRDLQDYQWVRLELQLNNLSNRGGKMGILKNIEISLQEKINNQRIASIHHNAVGEEFFNNLGIDVSKTTEQNNQILKMIPFYMEFLNKSKWPLEFTQNGRIITITRTKNKFTYKMR